MSLRAGRPKPSEPSRWTRKLNGDVDHINGYDDGEHFESRAYEGPQTIATGNLDYETAEYLFTH